MYIKGVNKGIFKNFKKEYLNQLLLEYPDKKIIDKINKLINECKNNLNLRLLSNLNINYWLVRGWSLDEANKKIKELKEKRKKPKYSVFNYNFWINKGLSKEEAIKKVYNIQKKNNDNFNKKRQANPENYKTSSPMTVEFWVNKGLSEDEAKIKIKSQRKLNKEYWIEKGFLENEAIKNVSIYQKENYEKLKIKKEKTPEKYDGYLPTQLKYWINKTNGDIEESKKLLIKRQTTFSLEKCIDKYGEKKGLERWEERQKKWKEKVFNKNTYIGRGRSNISEEFFKTIINKFNINKQEVLYGENEKIIYDSEYKRAYKYDFTYNKKIIEFNGDFWHGNPNKFKADEIHKIKKISIQEIWNYEKRKLDLIKSYGYKILIIWESDYKKNKEEIIDKCYKFLNE